MFLILKDPFYFRITRVGFRPPASVHRQVFLSVFIIKVKQLLIFRHEYNIVHVSKSQ
jgi:hypothetical protein